MNENGTPCAEPSVESFEYRIADLRQQLADEHDAFTASLHEWSEAKETKDKLITTLRQQLAEAQEATKYNDYLRDQLVEASKRIANLEQLISDKPHTKTLIPDEVQRLWEACNTLVEKAEFKAVFRYMERIEQGLAEAQEAREQAEKLLHDLTPMGSEFANNPERCAEWIREHISSLTSRVVEAQAAKGQAQRERDEWQAKLTPEYALALGHTIMAEWKQTVIAERDALKEQLAAEREQARRMREALELSDADIAQFAEANGGIEVHRSWRDNMCSQGRYVSSGRMVWAGLFDEDKALDKSISRDVITDFMVWLRARAALTPDCSTCANQQSSNQMGDSDVG